jgi:copper transport protein
MPGRRVLSLLALVGAAVVLSAAPASAHAILLRTDPSPQSTVAAPPAAVHLFFSEPVQGAFGAVRVFDVEGRRADGGEAPRAGQSRTELVLPLPRLRAGTYTVTWRVVSDDGHPVRGGFAFYVEAPSTISAVAIGEERGAGRIVGVGGGIARFAWFSALALVVGSMVVRRFVWTPAARAAGATDALDVFRSRFRPVVRASWATLAVAAAATLAFQAAKLSGLSVGRALRPAVVREVLGTTFGHVWSVQAVVTLALLVPVLVLTRKARPPLLSPDAWLAVGGALAGVLVATAALNGHARTDPHPVWAATSIALHLAAVAVWVGGLLGLVIIGLPALRSGGGEQRSALLAGILKRFSPLAVGAVVVLLYSGTVNSVLGFGAFSDLWRVTYGRAVLAKVVALAVALAIASRHLYILPRRLAASAGPDPVRSFRRSSALEAAVLVVALAVAAGLVDLVPGRAIALAAAGPVNAQQRAGGYAVQLFVDPTARGDNEVHVTFVDRSGLAAAAVVKATVALIGPDRQSIPVALRLLAPGHFVGTLALESAGTYGLAVSAPAPNGDLRTTFTFRLSSSHLSRPN